MKNIPKREYNKGKHAQLTTTIFHIFCILLILLL